MSDLESRVQVADLSAYLLATGWALRHRIQERVSVFEHGNDPRQVLVPADATFADYPTRIADALEVLAQVEQRAAREILTELLNPPADILRFRVVAKAAEGGLLPLPTAVDFLDGCHRALLSAACTVENPRPFHPRLSSPEADAFVGACKLGTERGSFVATVLCPLDAGVKTASALMTQLTLFQMEPQTRDTFARRVVSTVMKSADRLVRAIEANETTTLLTASTSEVVLSANLCEAILSMQPNASSDGKLIIEIRNSRMLPLPAEVPRQVQVGGDLFPSIAAVAAALRPREPEAVRNTFFGQVESLHGKPDEEKFVGGDIVVRFLSQDGVLLRARVSLAPQDYATACDAHKLAHTVAVTGILRRTARLGRIENPVGFRDLTATTTAPSPPDAAPTFALTPGSDDDDGDQDE